jgi:hypothetical protein
VVGREGGRERGRGELEATFSLFVLFLSYFLRDFTSMQLCSDHQFFVVPVAFVFYLSVDQTSSVSIVSARERERRKKEERGRTRGKNDEAEKK